MILKDFVYGDDGAPIQGALVEAYAPGESVPAATTLSGEDGSWELDLAPGVAYRIKYTWGGQSLCLESQIRRQVREVVGLDGRTAPFPDQGVITTQLKDGAVTTEKLADGAVTTEKLAEQAITTAALREGATTTAKLPDRVVTTTKLRDRSVTSDKLHLVTVNDADVPTGNTGSLATLLSWLANRLKVVMETSSWRGTPVHNLADIERRVRALEMFRSMLGDK